MKRPGTHFWSRRSLALALVSMLGASAAVLFVLLVLTVIDIFANGWDPTVAAPGASASGAATPKATESRSEGDPRTQDPEQTTATAGVASAMPTSGPGMTEPGLLLVVSPLPSGALDVVEQVKLPAPTNSITLSPADLSDAGSQFEQAAPVARAVQLEVAGQPVAVPGSSVTDVVSLPVQSTDTFTLNYQLEGATLRSVPSTARRAIAAVAPLNQGLPADLPVVVVATTGVLQISCPLMTLSEQSCGVGSPPLIRLGREITVEDALVNFQLDLPLT